MEIYREKEYDEYFKKYNAKPQIISDGDGFNNNYGTDFVLLTDKHIKAMQEGKALYVDINCGEYCCLLKKEMLESEDKKMNRQEILAEISELKERLNNLEKQYEVLTPSNKRWSAEIGCSYYYITTRGLVEAKTETGLDLDNSQYEFGNYFRTREEAKFEVERLKVIAELKEWATPINEFNCEDSHKKKYVLVNVNKGENSYLAVDFFYTNQVCDLCFESEEVAKSAIESVGEDRIIKYYFRRGENNANSN